MQSGSLTIGGTNTNCGGNSYTGASWMGNNTAGLLLECQDNTEIAVHDFTTRIAYCGHTYCRPPSVVLHTYWHIVLHT